MPAPATAELLAAGNATGKIEKEPTTPTGATLMKVLAVSTNDIPQGFSGSKIAYGAGTWDLEIPNVLRISIGELEVSRW